MSFLRIANLYKAFDRLVAVDRINLEIKQGEFFTLLGSSGCGKTTTLRMIGGLEKPEGGEILLGDQCLVSAEQRIFVKPEKRDMGMVPGRLAAAADTIQLRISEVPSTRSEACIAVI